MANLTPVPGWDDVFQLETTTQVLGGPGGISNRQGQQLLNRLAYIDSNLGSTRVGTIRGEAGAVGRNVAVKLQDIPSVLDFGAVGDGIAANQTAFTNTSAAVPYAIVPAGTYLFSANVTLNCAFRLETGAILNVAPGVTVILNGEFIADRSTHITGSGTVVFNPGSVDFVCAEWFGMSPAASAATNTTALQKSWVASFGTYTTIGRGAFPLGDTELKAFALSNTSQLPNGIRASGIDGNGGGGGVSANVGTTFYGNDARIHFNNDAPTNSDAKIILSGFHIVGPNDNTAGVGGVKVTKISNFILENTQVTGSRGHGYELIKCYGAVVRNNTALSCRQYGFLCNQQFNQALLQDNKAIGNGKDYTGIYANIAFSGGSGLESLAPVVINNDSSYAGANAVLYKRTNPSPGPNSIGISSIVVTGSVCTVTTVVPHGRSNGDYISVFGITSNVALNTVFTPQITATGTTTFTFNTSAPPGVYADTTAVIGPAAYGSIYNDMRGGVITHYAEDCIGISGYMGTNCQATKISGGYSQGFNIPGGGNGIILLDDPTNVSVDALSLSGANTRLIVNAGIRKHGINICNTVTVENSSSIQYAAIQLRDGQYYASAPPNAGTWTQGDWVQNLNAAPGQPQFWYCSAAPNTFTAIDGAAGGGSSLPPQAGNAGRVLGTDGTTTSWVVVSGASLPSQTGNAGRFLGTDGTNLSWNVVSGGTLPTQSGATVGRFLSSDGTNASWTLPASLSALSPNLGAITGGTITTSGSIQAGSFSSTGTGTFNNVNVSLGLTANTLNIVNNATVGGTFTGAGANFSGNVSAAGHIGGVHNGTTATFSGGIVGASLVATSGGMSVTGQATIAAASGISLTTPAPANGTGLRVTTAGGGSTGMTIDGGSGGTALNVIGAIRTDLGTSGGSATVGLGALTGGKPGNSTNFVWIPWNMNGIPGDILWAPRF